MKKTVSLIFIFVLIPAIASANILGWWDSLFNKQIELGANVCTIRQGCTSTSTLPTANQIWIGRDDGTVILKTLTAGTNITFSSTTGAFTITSSGGGSGGSNWNFAGPNAIKPTTTVGIIVSASSTFTGNLIGGAVVATDGGFEMWNGTSLSFFTDAGASQVGTIGITGSNLMTLDMGISPTLVINSSGYVGIATTTPGYPLTVAGSIQLLGDAPAGADLLMYENNSIHFDFGGTDNTTITKSPTNFEIASDLPIEVISNGSNITLNAFSSSDFFIEGTTGKVGIGTTTPVAKLDVSGGNIAIDNGQFYQQRSSAGVLTNIFGAGTSNILQIGSGSWDDIRFDFGGAGSRVYFKSDGNVGIGTSTPASLLSVGTTSGSQFLVSSLGQATTTQLYITGLLNCNTIDTDGSGKAICGSDETAGAGADGSSNWKFINSGAITPTSTVGIIVNAASSTFAGYLTAAGFTGKSSTTAALSANPTNCGAGQSPLGIDDLGNVESCFDVWTETENTSAGYLANQNWKTLTVNAVTPTSSIGIIVKAASSTFDGYITALGFTGKSSTTDAFVSNPTNCPSNQYPLGIDASGNVESCTADANTTYTGGDHLTLTGTDFDVDEDFVINGFASTTFPSYSYASSTYLLNQNWKTLTVNAIAPTSTIGLIVNASSTFNGNFTMQGNATTTGRLSLPMIAAGATRCLQIDATGNIEAATAACGSGLGGGSNTFNWIISGTNMYSTTTAGVRNIGVGTTTPRYTFDIWGDLSVGTTTAGATIGYPSLFVQSGNGFGVGIGTTTIGNSIFKVGTTSEYLVIDRQGKVGIATSSFNTNNTLTVQGNSLFYGSVTTTQSLVVGADGAAQAGCIAIRDVGGAAWTYVRASAGVLTASTTDCTGSATTTLIIGR